MSRLNNELKRIKKELENAKSIVSRLSYEEHVIELYLKEQKWKKYPYEMKDLGLMYAEQLITKKEFEEFIEYCFARQPYFLMLDGVYLSTVLASNLREHGTRNCVVFLHYPELKMVIMDKSESKKFSLSMENKNMICIHDK